MLLTEFLSALSIDVKTASDEVMVKGITSDSRKVEEGFVFFAIPGVRDDGAKYTADAFSQKAVAVIAEKGASLGDENIYYIENIRFALSKAARLLYPHQPKYVAAVTGTDGKTSTVNFLRQFLALAGRKSASIGTLGLIGPDGKALAGYEGIDNTTPDPLTLHKALDKLAGDGYEYLGIEASSHGLEQYRLHSLKIMAAGFTTFSQDHLDYHGTMENYFSAKMRLFRELLPEGSPVCLNADDAKYDDVVRVCAEKYHKIISYGYKGETLRVISADADAVGISLKLEIYGKSYETRMNLAGNFQIGNVLCAASMAHAFELPVDQIISLIPKLQPVRGRLELAGIKNGASIYVDYAHTPNALSKAILALRHHAGGKLGVVFGCGGDRDKGKRPEMGKVANDMSDFAIVTDDNPRGENAAEIREAVLAGCPKAIEIGDRKEAIAKAISMLVSGDMLLIAGKGHEDYQIVGNTKLPFDDAKVVREIVSGNGDNITSDKNR